MVQSPCVKIDRDEVDKENKPMLSTESTVKSTCSRDVFSSDSDFVSKSVPLRKVCAFLESDDVADADWENVDTNECELC